KKKKKKKKKKKEQRNETVMNTYDREIFEKEIKNGAKPHLENVNLDEKQLRTCYMLDNELIEIVFYSWKGDKCTIAIDFEYPFDVVDEIVNQSMRLQVDLKKQQLLYKIGIFDIPRYLNSFVRCIFEVLAQQKHPEAIEYPFHIYVQVQPVVDLTHAFTLITKSNVSLTSIKYALHLPAKAIAPTFTQLFPLQTFQQLSELQICVFLNNNKKKDEKDKNEDVKNENVTTEQTEKNEKQVRVLEDIMIWQIRNSTSKKQRIDIGKKMVAEIPLELQSLPFRIQVIDADDRDNSYENDVRVRVTYPRIECSDDPSVAKKHWLKMTNPDNDAKYESIKFKVPLVVYCKVEKNSRKKYEFKSYRYWKEVNRWFADSECVQIVDDLIDNEWLQVNIFGYYDIWVREQVSFLGLWVDRSIFCEKFHRDYNYLSEEDQLSFERGGKSYYLPQGWKRYSLNVRGWNSIAAVPDDQKKESDIEDWCVGYYATDIKFLPSILRDHLVSSETVLAWNNEGTPPLPQVQHVQDQSTSQNRATPYIRLSPCINYCTHPNFLSSSPLDHTADSFCNLILMIRVNPSSIQEGPEMIGWGQLGTLDPLYSNQVIEWKIQNPKDCIVYGLLVKESKVTSQQIWSLKEQMAKNNDKSHLHRDVFALQDIIQKRTTKKTEPTSLSFVKHFWGFGFSKKQTDNLFLSYKYFNIAFSKN
ncbi:hypothetical protein RFI_15747, partial [Reticulomyxa filosa]